MSGLKPCVIGLIGSAVISMALTVFVPNGFKNIVLNRELIISIVIFLLSMLLVSKKKHPIMIIGIVSGLVFI